jgi:hypothetical protein
MAKRTVEHWSRKVESRITARCQVPVPDQKARTREDAVPCADPEIQASLTTTLLGGGGGGTSDSMKRERTIWDGPCNQLRGEQNILKWR